MAIETKYQPGQTLFFLLENKVTARECIRVTTYSTVDTVRILYAVRINPKEVEFNIDESLVADTKENLLATL